jgi:TolB-like protein
MPAEPVAFGPFLLNPDNRILLRDGEPIAVGQRGALLLGALLKNPGQVRTKAELMDAAWPGTAVEESNLSVQIASLRKLLGPSPNGGEWIATIPRVGYRLIAEPEAQPAVHTRVGQPEMVVPSLAVLPFQNLSGDPEQDYFADGIVEDIITALSRFKSFAVIARNSSFVYKSRAVDVRQVAEDLGVRYVLEGSVRRAGDRLRISAQLVNGMSGAHLWAQSFDGALDNVFDFQDRITESVATVIEPHIHAAEIERSRLERPGSIAAYDLYLQALPRILSEAASDNAEAYALLMQALALEPDNAVALAFAAWTLEHRTTMGWPPIGPDDKQKCVELAHRGLRYAKGDARVMAHCGMALQGGKEYDWGMAVVLSAAEANPNNVMVAAAAGVTHLHLGNIEDALAYLHRLIRLSPRDPFSHVPLTGIAHAQMVLGNYSEALVWAARSLASNPNFDPTYWMLIAANAHLGRMDDAHRFLEQFRKVAPGVTIAKIKAGQPAKDPSRMAAILEGLRLAGLEA